MVNINYIANTAKWPCDPKPPVCLDNQTKT